MKLDANNGIDSYLSRCLGEPRKSALSKIFRYSTKGLQAVKVVSREVAQHSLTGRLGYVEMVKSKGQDGDT